jgi:hypothetical protein
MPTGAKEADGARRVATAARYFNLAWLQPCRHQIGEAGAHEAGGVHGAPACSRTEPYFGNVPTIPYGVTGSEGLQRMDLADMADVVHRWVA